MREKVLIIIPAFNEAENIIDVIDSLRGACLEWDFIVINDCSQDGTANIAEAATRELNDSRGNGEGYVINLPYNLGIGGAVQTGFKYACRNNYDIAVQFDGDGQHKASEIGRLIKPILNHEADVVIGSRFVIDHNGFKSTLTRRIGIKFFQVVNSLLINQKITDNTSGFRAYNFKAIEFLSQNYPTDYPEPEAVILLGRNGFRLKEIFTQMQERRAGASSIYGLKTCYYMVKVFLAIIMTALRPKVLRG